MDWAELTVETTQEGIEAVSALLLRAGAGGTVIEDPSDLDEHNIPGRWDMIDDALLEKAQGPVRVKCYLPQDERLYDSLSYVREQLQYIAPFGDYGALALTVDSVREEDWANEWKKHFKPLRIGKRIVVVPTWEEYAAQPDDLMLHIDPGMAFGTGTHESTAMCMQLLEGALNPGDTVTDVGCGSGILGIAAALLGAQSVLCIDIDPVAVSAAQSNIALNGLANATAQQGDLVAGLDPHPSDVILVNIIADVIIALLPSLRPHLKPGGRIIASGIIKDRLEDVLAAAKQCGYSSERIETLGEWHALCLV